MRKGLLVGIILAVVAFIMLGVGLQAGGPTMIAGFEEMRTFTHIYTEADNDLVTSVTGVNTSVNMTIDYPVYNDNVLNVVSITSNATERNGPVANTTVANVLFISGLTTNITRTLTVNYEYDPSDQYTALEETVAFGPTLVILAFIIIVAITGFLGIKLAKR